MKKTLSLILHGETVIRRTLILTKINYPQNCFIEDKSRQLLNHNAAFESVCCNTKRNEVIIRRDQLKNTDEIIDENQT